jgi:hypothetical protein
MIVAMTANGVTAAAIVRAIIAIVMVVAGIIP